MEEDTLYQQLHKLSAAKSEEALDQLVSTLWKTRKTGLRSFRDKSNLQSLLNLPSLSDLDPVLACVRSLIRKWVYEHFTVDDLLKLFPPDLPLDIQSTLLLLFQKYQSQWMEEVSSEQRALPRTSILNQDKEGASISFASFSSLTTLAQLWSRQDDAVCRLNQNELGALTPINSDANVSRLAPTTQQHDVVPSESLRNLPRLKSMTWTMENGSSMQSNKLAVVSLKMQDYTKCTSGEIEVKFQLTKDTLEAMLRSMTYIGEQLSGTASTSSEPMQKKQKQ